MTLAQLLAYIIANIATNGAQTITGALLQQTLKNVINRLATPFSVNIPVGEFAIVHNLGDQASHVTVWQLSGDSTKLVKIPDSSYDMYVKQDGSKFTTVYINSNVALPNCTVKISI